MSHQNISRRKTNQDERRMGQGFVQRAGIIRWIRGHHESRWWRRGRQQCFLPIYLFIYLFIYYSDLIWFDLFGLVWFILLIGKFTHNYSRLTSEWMFQCLDYWSRRECRSGWTSDWLIDGWDDTRGVLSSFDLRLGDSLVVSPTVLFLY